MATRKIPDEPHMRLRKDGRYEIIVFRGYTDDGKRKQKSFYGASDKEVIAKYEKYKKDLDDGLNVDTDYLFADWADIWYQNHKFNISPATQENYKYTLRVLKEAFGKRHIADIKVYDIEAFFINLRKSGACDSRITQCRTMLYQILHKAEANDFIRKNPVPFVDKIKKRGPSKHKDSFTAEEVKVLLQSLPNDRIGWSIRLLLGTGMRTQELLALEPRHIAPDGSRIYIEQAINMVKGTAVVGIPKSRDSYRQVPVPESIRWCAMKLRDTDATFIWEMKKKDCPCNPSAFRDHYKRALEAIPGVRVLSPHCCRHTYVSLMQALGVDIYTIQSIVGHADIDMTQQYLHVQESIRQNATEIFNREFGSCCGSN